MDPAEKQLADMLKEFKSRSKLKVFVESGFFALILFVGLVGNFITLLVMLLNRHMRTIPNMFVASLAISDIGLGILTAGPLGFSVLVTSKWPFKDATCHYQGFMAVTLGIASIHTLTLMAVNRYFRIVQPAIYRRFFTKNKAMIMIILSWLYSMTAPLPYLFSGHKMVFYPSKFFCYLQIYSGAFTAILVAVYIGLPTNVIVYENEKKNVIVYCYLKIFQTVRSHNINFQTSEVGTSTINVEEIKIARTLFVLVVVFNLCWTPLLLIDIVDTIRGSWTFSREVYVAYSFLGTISSASNPLLYGLLNKNFHKEFLKVLRCVYCRSQVAVEPVFLTLKRVRSQPQHGNLTTE